MDAVNDEPIIGASVSAGHGVGVVTDVDGNFTIQVAANTTKLTISYVGYTAQTVDVGSGALHVKLHPSTTSLDELIVVSYGTVKRSEYTGSAGVVAADQLENAQVSNVTKALSGKMAGVQTFSSNGQPGTSATIHVRGTGSINASTEPLYVVDGMPYDGEISNIAASDIEQLTVMKDAASTALYGARGANGVVNPVVGRVVVVAVGVASGGVGVELAVHADEALAGRHAECLHGAEPQVVVGIGVGCRGALSESELLHIERLVHRFEVKLGAFDDVVGGQSASVGTPRSVERHFGIAFGAALLRRQLLLHARQLD